MRRTDSFRDAERAVQRSLEAHRNNDFDDSDDEVYNLKQAWSLVHFSLLSIYLVI